MGKKIRNRVSNLGIEGNSESTIGSIEQTNSTEEGRVEEVNKSIVCSSLKGPREAENIEVDLSFDISTSVTGVVLINSETSELVKMDFIKLNTVNLTNLFQKADYANEWLKQNLVGYKIKRIFVEANLKAFAVGSSSANVLFTLAKMNALISYLAYKMFNVPVFDINVTEARSKIGYKDNRKIKKPVKEKVREFILAKYPDLPIKYHIAKNGKSKGQMVMDEEMKDCIDAFVIGTGANIIHRNTNTEK